MSIFDTLGGALRSLMTSDYPMEQDLRSRQLGEAPPEGPVTRRPSVLPLTRDPSGKMVLAMPKIADILGDMMGGGPAGTVSAGVRVPELWHGVSKVKLPKPVAEMTSTRVGELPVEKVISPADLQGGMLLPAIGDRSMAGGMVTAIGDKALNAPVPLQGGHNFMAAGSPEGAVWASSLPVISQLANKARRLGEETGKPVYFPYTAMGERSIDFSHHISDALAGMVDPRNMGKRAITDFDKAMRGPTPGFAKGAENFPGVMSEQLRDYMRAQPGDTRSKFAKLMDTANYQTRGFPSVAEARVAATDPRLLNETTGASGLSISRLDPSGKIIKEGGTPHLSYPAKLGGEYVGGLGQSVPKDVMYPDIIRALRKMGYGDEMHDYLLSRIPKGAPIAQKADQRWVDRISTYLERAEK